MLKHSPPSSLLCRIVGNAVSNKYVEPYTVSGSRREIMSTLLRMRGKPAEELQRMPGSIGNEADDVRNQCAVVLLIADHWSKGGMLARPLSELNRQCLGQQSVVLRRTEFVSDFGGRVRVAVDEVGPRLDELEKMAEAAVVWGRDAGVSLRAALLAFVYGAVVRIHPFEDGNGRAGRMYMLYALSRWGEPLFTVSKVRNSVRWRTAMKAAVGGNHCSLEREIRRRMLLARKGSSATSDGVL